MKNKLIGEAGKGTKATKQKPFAIIFNRGDEVVAGLKAFAGEKGLAASHFTAIGAFKNVVLGYFDWDKKDYTKILIHEQVEVLSLVGDVTLDEGKPNIHAHVVLGKQDGSTCGGHLIEARGRPTLEVMLTEGPDHLIRRFDRGSGVELIVLVENT